MSGMKSTKDEILVLLKRNGGHSVSELAGTLGLSTVTVRQHLTHLERDALVATAVSHTNGRQHYVYRLTAKAHAAAFPRRSDRLVELLMREIGLLDASQLEQLTPRERTSMIVRRLAHRLADEYASLLQGWPLQERVVFVTEVMQADGGFAEWEETGQGYEIRDFNCLFHRLFGRDGEGEVCEWHSNFLSQMLGTAVRVSPCQDSEEHCCRFVIEELSPVVAAR